MCLEAVLEVERLGEVQRADHHGRGSQWVAGALEVVPLDTVQLPYMLSLSEVHAVEVGRATSIKPPTWTENEEHDKVNIGSREINQHALIAKCHQRKYLHKEPRKVWEWQEVFT